MVKVALIPGHTADSRGAVNFKGESEYPWALRNLTYVQKALVDSRICDARIFDRTKIGIDGATRQAGEWGADISIELHFNAATPTAKGCEALIVKGDANAFQVGDFLTDILNSRMNIFERHRDGVKEMTDGERGFNNVNQAKINGIKYYCLLEPCFNHEYSESIVVFENEPYFATILAEGILGFVNSIGAASYSPTKKADLGGLAKAIKNTTSFEVPSLKPICLAQYLLESGKVTSRLSIEFFNFGGMKWREELKNTPGCRAIQYQASDGLDLYAACEDYESFFKYYWGFLARARYSEWKVAASKSPEAFINYIAQAGYCPSQTYTQKIVKLLPEAENLLQKIL
ncbi:MAG: glucosaminidase domain-containing protein [Candidatus Ozemobacteraceae bacterium]